ncbi:glycosyltransferase family 2 protein [Methylopila musalis]|uniref:Glycosyltransferase family 2 protein n=1 Tax=Methylopila musalis TaxID=1134781 RepID=A0ABW3Z3H8_9HYPH
MTGVAARGSKVAIVAIARNEMKYIVEWVAHYRRLGAAEIIIFDNESTDGTSELLAELDGAGFLRHVPIQDADCGAVAPQVVAYRKGFEQTSAEWILFCDIDEFLHLEDGLNFDSYVSQFEDDVGVVLLNWRAFGSGGQSKSGDAPVTERFTQAAFSQSEANKWVKSLVRRRLFLRPAVHIAYSKGRYVNADGTEFVTAVRSDGKEAKSKSANVVHKPAALAHFGTKSEEEFVEKIARGTGKPSQQGKSTPTGEARQKWKTYNVNDEYVDYFVKTAGELRKEISYINKTLGLPDQDEKDDAGLVARLRRMLDLD